MFGWIDNIKNFFNNTGVCTLSLVLEGVNVLVVSYALWNCYKIFFLSGNEDDKFSSFINRTFISSGLYYILRFSEAFLLSHFK